MFPPSQPRVFACYLYFSQDHAELEAEIERLRDDLKPKVAALHKLEGTCMPIGIMHVYFPAVYDWELYSQEELKQKALTLKG